MSQGRVPTPPVRDLDTPEEVAEWREVPNAFITAALSEGMVLYES